MVLEKGVDGFREACRWFFLKSGDRWVTDDPSHDIPYLKRV